MGTKLSSGYHGNELWRSLQFLIPTLSCFLNIHIEKVSGELASVHTCSGLPPKCPTFFKEVIMWLNAVVYY